MTRREAISAALAAAVPAAQSGKVPEVSKELIGGHDNAVEQYLKNQIADPAARHRGGMIADDGLVYLGHTGGIIEVFNSAFLCPQSRFHRDPELARRIELAAGHLQRELTPDGNFWLPITNFNSPPDTAFSAITLATTAHNSREYGAPEIHKTVMKLLGRMGPALARGGVHTPNHRWVVTGALAQIYALDPRPEYLRRIDQWLAEGIDIDADGMYTERSTAMYNGIVDRAFAMAAHKLKRPQLLEPVRRNLDAMLYLLHADFEVVTEISHRQDANAPGTMVQYLFPLTYLAVRDGNGRYAAIAKHHAASVSLGWLLEYPELARVYDKIEPPPDNYEREFPANGLVRIRRGLTSATILSGRNRFFTLRHGGTVITAVRFASAFFGKGQFVGTHPRKADGGWLMEQHLEGPYFQPFDPPRPIDSNNFDSTRHERRQSEVSKLTQSVTIMERKGGFTVRFRAAGTNDVPVAIEINLRDGGSVTGVTKTLLERGYAAFESGGNSIRFGPGAAPHRYVAIRGADAKLPGQSVFITGATPFDHTLEFDVS